MNGALPTTTLPTAAWRSPTASQGGTDAGIRGTLLIAGSPELWDPVLAKVVDKYADPGYREKWADTIRAISGRHEARIRALGVCSY